MRLEMQCMKVDYLIAGEKTCAKDQNLYVNIEELKKHLLEADEKLTSLDIRVIDKDNDDTRFANVVDVIQPRCKLEGGTNFPGFIDEIETAGKGITRSLEDTIVVVCVAKPAKGRTVQKFFDTGGTGARLTEYSTKNILYIGGETVEGTSEADHEDALRFSGMRAAVYLAQHAEGLPLRETEVYDLDLHNHDNPDKLPRICYYYQVYAPHYDHANIATRVLYGQTVTEIPPTILHPNEILDGAMSGVHIQSYSTYDNQNHGIIKELYKRHQNKEIIFCGVVIGVLSMSELRRSFFVKQSGKLIKEVLNADGVMLTKFHGGAAHLDSALIAIECEKLGIATSVHITPFTDVGKLADNLVFADERMNLIIAGFTYFAPVDIHFEYKTFLGAPKDSYSWSERTKYSNTRLGSFDLETEAVFIAGYCDFLGRTKLRAMEY